MRVARAPRPGGRSGVAHRLGVVRHFGRPDALAVCDRHRLRDCCRAAHAAADRSGAPGRDATAPRTARPLRRSAGPWHKPAGAAPPADTTTSCFPSTAVDMGPKAARVRSGFVQETRAKSAEFAGIRFRAQRRRKRRNTSYLQVKSRRQAASSAVCHAEGRGFESLQPLQGKPRKRGLSGFPSDQSAKQRALSHSGQALGQGAVEQRRSMSARAALVIARRRFLACSGSAWAAARPRTEVARRPPSLASRYVPQHLRPAHSDPRSRSATRPIRGSRLGLTSDYGARVEVRVRAIEGPFTEIQILEFPSQQAMDDFQTDPRRLDLTEIRMAVIASTTVIRVGSVTG